MTAVALASDGKTTATERTDSDRGRATPLSTTRSARPRGNDPRPLGGYAVLMGVYGSIAAVGTLVVRRRRGRIEPLTPLDVVVLGLAIQHLSRLITKDSVTATLRSPFTDFTEAAGEGEVNEEVAPGGGLRHAIGELVTCPFCVAQWVATALVLGRSLLPGFTTAVASVCALARVSDYLQLLYGWARNVD